MALISEKDLQAVRAAFNKQLQNDVMLVFFTHSVDSPEFDACYYCTEMEQLLGELASLSDRIELLTYDFAEDEDVRKRYGILRAPALAIVGDQDYGIRYYGIPSGYEAQSLIEDIVDVSAGQSELSDETLAWLENLNQPVHLQVFVTPTCPYCPSAVRTAHRLALASNNIIGDMIEATEFPELSQKYGVYGVPRVVINDDHHFEGALPERRYVAEIRKALLGIAEAR